MTEFAGNAAGYATLLLHDISGSFKEKNIPVIVDFNVLEKYRRNGIGTAIMDAVLHKGCMSSEEIFPMAVEFGLMVNSGNNMSLYFIFLRN